MFIHKTHTHENNDVCNLLIFLIPALGGAELGEKPRQSFVGLVHSRSAEPILRN